MQPGAFSVEQALQGLDVQLTVVCGQVVLTVTLLAVTPGGAMPRTYFCTSADTAVQS